MAEVITLEASRRQVIGKKVRQLRRQGQIPAVLYGPEFEPIALSINQRELRNTLAQAGGTKLIELHVDGEKIPALARSVQREPIRGEMLHVDFYRVSMDRPISAEVPVVLVNESPAVASGSAILNHIMNTIEVEALPAQLPDHIEVDLSTLTEVGAQLRVSDLKVPEGARILARPEEPVVRLDHVAAAEIEEEAGEGLFMVESQEVEVITERKREEEE